MRVRKKRVLSLFDYSCTSVKAFAENGYECWCVDIQHPKGINRNGNVIKVGADLRNWIPPMGIWDFVMAWPPCTHLAVSGARWFREKGLHALADAIRLFAIAVDICEASGAPFCIENPVSTISSYYRKPDHTFNPWEYALYNARPETDAYSKKTCLWVGGGFVMPPKKQWTGLVREDIHRMPPSDERANLRSATPEGFARALYEANQK